MNNRGRAVRGPARGGMTMAPEDNPADEVQPTKEEWEAHERLLAVEAENDRLRGLVGELVASMRELIGFANYSTKPGIAMSDPYIKPYEAIGRAEKLIAKATGDGGQGR